MGSEKILQKSLQVGPPDIACLIMWFNRAIHEEFMSEKEMEPQSNETATSNHECVERNKFKNSRRKPSAKPKRRTFSELVDLVSPNVNGEKVKKRR